MATGIEDRRVHERLDKLEDDFAIHREEHRRFEENLAENTRLTQLIADNTCEMVDLFKGAKSVRRFVLWSTPFGAALVAIAAACAAAWQWLKTR